MRQARGWQLASRRPLRPTPTSGADPHPKRVREVSVHSRKRQLLAPEEALAAVLTGEAHHRGAAVLGQLHPGDG
ncbi:hypothetical protein [Streptomyces sp. CdTB01]|uniref:hypothetical protein n=1 Tax=Streptomyces sp. CdTB01 TaxID=1725411 RepID=UPI00131F1D40|nr:hypothetical protein [Streptomyces sp. CdTB01]